jgi:hypothetical protein
MAPAPASGNRLRRYLICGEPYFQPSVATQEPPAGRSRRQRQRHGRRPATPGEASIATAPLGATPPEGSNAVSGDTTDSSRDTISRITDAIFEDMDFVRLVGVISWLGGGPLAGGGRSGGWRPGWDPCWGAPKPCNAGASGSGSGSGEFGDVRVGGEDGGRVGPAVEDADDVAAGVADEPSGSVPEPPAQRLGLGAGEGSGEAEELEPAHFLTSSHGP